MKILITGGNGFIARNLFEQFSSKYALTSFNRQEFDLLDPARVFEYLKDNRFDVVIHTATYDAAPKHSIKDPTKVLENNLKMFFNLARCKDYFGKMIYYGSGAEFDRPHWQPKMKEDYFDKYVPQDQYGFSKYIMNKYTQTSGNIYNLRLFAVFGKYEDWRVRFISNACCSAVLDLPININQNKSFDFLHIDDLVNITKWFIENTPSESAYNVCSGKVFDFFSVANKILVVSGKRPDIVIKNKDIVIEYSGDNSKLMGLIQGYGFKDMDQSIRELYNWYLVNKHSINREFFDAVK